jgi:predicted transcriptional regulator
MNRRQNLTIQLDAELIKKARLLAVQRSTSVSRLVADELEHLIDEDEQYQAACRQALDDLQRGFDLGGGLLPSREELHER